MSNDKVIAFYIRTANKGCKSMGIQKEQLEVYCKLYEIENYKFYIDDGYADDNLERPALQKLIQDAKDKKISQCIVYELSRFSRSARKTLHIISNLLIPNEVNVISLADSLDTSTPIGKFLIEAHMKNEVEKLEVLCQAIKR